MSNRAVLTGRPVTRHGPMDTVPVLARHKRRAVLGPMGRPVMLAQHGQLKLVGPFGPVALFHIHIKRKRKP